MKQPEDRVRGEPALIPEGVFVIQLRSDSAVLRRRLRGRVEHVMSGQSAPFASLATLLAFMARHAATGMAPTQNARKRGIAMKDDETPMLTPQCNDEFGRTGKGK